MGYRPSLFGQDGWILTKFFSCMFMDRDAVEFRKLAKKKEAILTEQAWSIKDSIIWLFGKFFLQDTAGNGRRKKRQKTEGKKAGRASKTKLGFPLAQGMDPPLVSEAFLLSLHILMCLFFIQEFVTFDKTGANEKEMRTEGEVGGTSEVQGRNEKTQHQEVGVLFNLKFASRYRENKQFVWRYQIFHLFSHN